MREAWLLWERGISVVPVPAPGDASDGKRPSMPWKTYQSRLPYVGEMQGWFNHGKRTNYAVITGAVSGICVVDADDRPAMRWVRWNLRPTPWVVKTSRGAHYYFRTPSVPVRNRARLNGSKIDVRGEGGYVIGPGSCHASGALYRCAGNWSVPKGDLPVFDVGALERPEPPAAPSPAAPFFSVDRDAIGRARSYLRKVPCPELGFGSDAATFVAACRLVRGFGLSADEACGLLQEWAPDFDAWWLASKVETASKYGSEPTGGRL